MSKYEFGVSTFILVSPFTDQDLDQFDVAKEMGYDLIEVCIEDPAVVSAEALKNASERTGLPVSICGAFGPDRDVSHEDPQKRRQGIDYLKLCVDIAQAVRSPHVAGPMYSATGKARLLPRRNAGSSASGRPTACVKWPITPLNAASAWP